jgi:hypothetical protein
MTDARVDELVVNGRIYAQMSDELPADLGNRLAHCDRFLQQYPFLWVEDPATNVLSPYWLTSEQKDLVEQLKSVALRPSELSAELLQTFAQANILLRKDFEESRCEDWSRKFEALRRELETKQYAVLRDIIPPLQLAALRKYVRALDRKMYLELEERTIAENRYSIHNDETARFIHHQLTRLVNRIIPDQMIPSFTFLSVHKPGAQLHRHTDRPQCAWNLSLLIDTEPEAGLADAWPFYLEIEGRSEKVQLEMGDAVLYSGKRTPHWRNALPAGQQVALIFCCFVPVSFRGFLT